MNKRKKRWIAAVLALCALPLAWHGLEAWEYANGDAIERVKIDMEYRLARYERSADPAEMRDWILNGPSDAALGSKKYYTLRDWALEHPQQFVRLIESLPSRERNSATERFGYALESSETRQKRKEALRSCCASSATAQRILRAL